MWAPPLAALTWPASPGWPPLPFCCFGAPIICTPHLGPAAAGKNYVKAHKKEFEFSIYLCRLLLLLLFLLFSLFVVVDFAFQLAKLALY